MPWNKNPIRKKCISFNTYPYIQLLAVDPLPLKIRKSLYVMTNYGKIFADDIANFLIDVSGFKKLQFKMSVYYKYATDGYKIVELSYVDDCVFCYS